MAAKSVLDYATPYELMIGQWSGMTTTYDAKGQYQGSVASLVTCSWVKRNSVLRYQQEELADLDQVLKDGHQRHAVSRIINHDFNLKITGKACRNTGVNKEKLTLMGAETRPGIYLFHLTFPQGHYYNNQYFVSPNERHIIGPFVPAGGGHEFAFVVAQTFTRISYEVPATPKRRGSARRA